MSFAQALVRSINRVPYSETDSDEIKIARRNYPLPIDFYLGDLVSAYPARSVSDLVTLIDSIETSSKLSQQEQALIIYYMFLSYDSVRNARGLAEYYAKELFLPISWQNYARSLWCIEKKQNDRALVFLSTFPAPKQVIDSFIAYFGDTPNLLCLFFDTHRQYLDHDNLELYISALCNQALYFNVLEIMRGYTLRQEEILETLGKHAAALSSGPDLAAFVSVPFSPDEWSVIQSYLDKEPTDSSAAKLSLTRALHLGDLTEIHKAMDVPEFALLTKSYDDY